MAITEISRCTSFAGTRRLARGPAAYVVLRVKEVIEADPALPVLTFDDANGRVLDLDIRGSVEEVLARLGDPTPPAASTVAKGRGRPRLGVVAREVTLLPRHWDWLAAQPGGASVALRKLVEEARRRDEGPSAIRHAQEAAYAFMSAMAGDAPGYEEALRALFAREAEAFDAHTLGWPADVREHARLLAAPALQPMEGNHDDRI